jgi:hypothetical protein
MYSEISLSKTKNMQTIVVVSLGGFLSELNHFKMQRAK